MPDGAGAAERRLLGQGREAEIFEWDDDTVLRLLRSPGDRGRVDQEAAAMQAAADGGVDVPAMRGTTTVDGRPGVVMDRVDGPDLITLMGKRPWTVPRVARIVGKEHAAMHQVVAPTELRSLREMVRWKIENAADLPTELADFALDRLDTLPDGDRLCHGDFHPGNILMGPRGPAVIDWIGAARGDPAGDLARTRLLLRQGDVPDHMPALIRRMNAIGRNTFSRIYVRAYARARPIDSELVDRWEVVRIADRVWEGIDAEQPILLAQLKRYSNESG